MDNYMPQRYEEIGENPVDQWEKWRSINGRTVTIYDSKVECLREWWALTSAVGWRSKGKEQYFGKLSKKVFIESPNGSYLLFIQEPFVYVELKDDREVQWANFKIWNGLSVRVFKNHCDCILEKNAILGLGVKNT